MTQGPVPRAAAALVSVLLALSPLAGGIASAQGSDIATPPIVVTLTTLRPIAPQPGDTLVIRGTVTNVSDLAVSDLAADLRMSGPVGARSTFDEFADEPNGDVSDLTEALGEAAPLSRTTLGPGATEPFRITASLDPATTGLSTSSWEVRELGVDITGLTETGSESVGSLRTFLPWAPRDAVGPQRLQVAWLWPLVDQPHRVTSSTWLDDDLAAQFAPGGRLSNLVTAASTAANQAPPPPVHHGPGRRKNAAPNPFAAVDVPVTWAIDPMLVDDADAMRGSYQVAGSPKPTAGKGSANARAWLSALRNATSGGAVVSLPYGDPDVVAAVRSGLSTLVGVAATAGQQVLRQLLPGATLTETGWPPDGFIDQHAVDALFSDGTTSLILSDSALPPVVTPNQTPSSRASLVTAAGDIPTALSDSILSDAVSQGASSGADSAVGLQRFLAETLMIEAEAPSTPQRNILITPSARWQPSESYAASLLADTGKVPWLAPTTVGAILDSQPDTSLDREPLDYPAAARNTELPASYLHQVGDRQHQLSELTNILPTGDTETRPLSTGLLRALSTAWRGVPAQRRGWLDQYSRSLNSMYNSVHVVSAARSTVTLTGHGGKVPITIANTLDAPARITVQLVAIQLKLPGNGRVAVTLPADQQTTVDVHATAKTSGVFSLDVQLLTPSGQKYGTRVQLYVRSTVYGTITLVITGVATAALLVAVAIRLTRRAIHARRASNAAAS